MRLALWLLLVVGVLAACSAPVLGWAAGTDRISPSVWWPLGVWLGGVLLVALAAWQLRRLRRRRARTAAYTASRDAWRQEMGL